MHSCMTAITAALSRNWVPEQLHISSEASLACKPAPSDINRTSQKYCTAQDSCMLSSPDQSRSLTTKSFMGGYRTCNTVMYLTYILVSVSDRHCHQKKYSAYMSFAQSIDTDGSMPGVSNMYSLAKTGAKELA